jgi:S1-C subfamily serine protease
MAAAPAAWALTPSELFAKVGLSVWEVQADQGQPGTGALGSAVEVGPRTLITACHVVKSATSVRVTRQQSKTSEMVTAVTRDPDQKRDLCMLTVNEDLPAPPVQIAPMDTVKVGERVYAIGAPLGLEGSLTEGLVSALRPIPGETLPDIQVSATTAPGSSGGGLFDDQGRLVGMTAAIANKESEGLSFAYPAQWTIELPARVAAERTLWRQTIARYGVKLGPNGDAAPSGFAELNDVTKVPAKNKPLAGVDDAYRQFLLLAKPRAFLLTSDNHWGTVSDPWSLDSLMQDCAKRKITCRFYAIDDAVVWQGEP